LEDDLTRVKNNIGSALQPPNTISVLVNVLVMVAIPVTKVLVKPIFKRIQCIPTGASTEVTNGYLKNDLHLIFTVRV